MASFTPPEQTYRGLYAALMARQREHHEFFRAHFARQRPRSSFVPPEPVEWIVVRSAGDLPDEYREGRHPHTVLNWRITPDDRVEVVRSVCWQPNGPDSPGHHLDWEPAPDGDTTHRVIDSKAAMANFPARVAETRRWLDQAQAAVDAALGRPGSPRTNQPPEETL